MSMARRRIAYFSPLPPERSGIADYSNELVQHLAQLADITLFATQPEKVADSLHRQFAIRPAKDYPSVRWEYDIALYQMGNSKYHEHIYQMLRRYPAITVLHEYHLHHLAVDCTIAHKNFPGYIREMGYALGAEGIQLARQVRKGQRELPLFEFPLTERVLDSSLGIIVHSQYVQQRILQRRPQVLTAVVPHLSLVQGDTGALLSRKELGCPEDALIFATAGQITKAKQVTLALEAFASLLKDFSQALYLVIGEEPGRDVNLADWLQQRGLENKVIYTDYVQEESRFLSWMAAADVLINLRYPTVGETSGTVLRGMALGLPLIVNDVGWYAELPSDACRKVPPNDVEALLLVMRRLASDASLRREMGQQAANYVQRKHHPSRVAKMYMDFVEQVLAGPSALKQS